MHRPGARLLLAACGIGLFVAATLAEETRGWLADHGNLAATVVLVAVTWRYVELTRQLAHGAEQDRHERHRERAERRHATLASLLAQLDSWVPQLEKRGFPDRPMSMTLYDEALRYTWELWDEIRPVFIELGPMIATANSDGSPIHASALRETVSQLRPLLRSYLAEYVVRCTTGHLYRLPYVVTGHGPPSELGHCPKCHSALELQPLGFNCGAAGPRDKLPEFPGALARWPQHGDAQVRPTSGPRGANARGNDGG